MKILILALSGIGDALMASPAIRILKEKAPDAQIDVLTMFKAAGDIFRNNPLINEILFCDFLHVGYLNSYKYIMSLRGKYDASINVYPANRFEYNLMNFMIGANKRCGVDYVRENFKNLSFLNNIRVQEDDKLHNVVENVRLVEKLLDFKSNSIPKLELHYNQEHEIFADEYINKNTNKKLLIGCHPGCNTLKNHINRRWEPEKFGGLAKKLVENFDCNFLVFGGPEEKDLKNTVVESSQSESVISVEAKSLTQTFAIMKKCDYFVTNDSSLMHAASALGLYVFPIIGPTNLAYIKPWGTDFTEISLNLECAPCFFYSPKPLSCSRTDKQYKCVRDIDVDFAYSIIEKKINERAKRD